MRRRPSKLLMVTAAAAAALLVTAGCEAKVYGTPPSPAGGPQLVVVAPQGASAPLPEAPPNEPPMAFTGLDDPGAAGHCRRCQERRRHQRRRPRSEHRPVGHQRRRRHRHRLGGQALHRRRSAAAGVEGPDSAVRRRPRGVRPDAAVSPTTTRPRCSGTAAAERAIINRVVARYGLSSTRPNNGQWFNTISTVSDLVHYYDMLLAGTGGLPPGAGQHHLVQPCGVGSDGTRRHDARRRLPAAVRHSRRAGRRTRCRQTGLDVLHRLGLDAPVDRRDRTRPSLRDGDQLDAVHRPPTTARATITQAVKTMFPGGL